MCKRVFAILGFYVWHFNIINGDTIEDNNAKPLYSRDYIDGIDSIEYNKHFDNSWNFDNISLEEHDAVLLGPAIIEPAQWKFINGFALSNTIQNTPAPIFKGPWKPDMSQFFGTNQHYEEPSQFTDFSRRRLIPYQQSFNIDKEAEIKLRNKMKAYLAAQESRDNGPIPVKAAPELVLFIAKQSALLEASKVKNPSEDYIKNDILRTGNYWNDVWQEDVDVDLLRAKNKKESQGVKITIESGTKLYELVSKLKKISPRLLYVINKD